jgi:hypothetical protein
MRRYLAYARGNGFLGAFRKQTQWCLLNLRLNDTHSKSSGHEVFMQLIQTLQV